MRIAELQKNGNHLYFRTSEIWTAEALQTKNIQIKEMEEENGETKYY